MGALLPTALAMTLGIAACSSTSSSSSSESFHCCSNHAYYACATQEQYATCGKADTTCPRDPSKDSECK